MNVIDATAAIVFAVGMALVFGGTAALSFASAPATFRSLKAVDAGRAFGGTLRIFDAMGLWASLAAFFAAVADTLSSQQPPAVVRVVLAATIVALFFLVRHGIAPRMAALKPPETEDEDRRWQPENRVAFARLHAQYVRIYSANLFLSLAALAIHALER